MRFYRDGMGLRTRGIVGTDWTGDAVTPAGAVVMFELESGARLALYPRSELAKDANIAPEGVVAPAAPTVGEFSLGQIVGARADVDALLEQARSAGATVTDEPHERPWGIYSGYFRDPDGHLWEIIYDARSEAG